MSEILSRELWESIRDEGWAHYPAKKGSNYKTSINLRALHESDIDATIEALAEALKVADKIIMNLGRGLGDLAPYLIAREEPRKKGWL